MSVTINLITEQFLTIQGEGRSIGKLAYFIRFAGCNLWCSWCDSMHSVDPAQFKGKTVPINYSLIPDDCRLIVLTGGEPSLFDLKSVRNELLKSQPNRIIEVESNATQFPEEILDLFHWNLSPKLSSSRQKHKEMDAKRLSHLKNWSDYSRSQKANVIFKFVIADPADREEVLQLVTTFNIPNHLVYLMPEGTSPQSQSLDSVHDLIEFAKANHFNFSPRLHVMFWGDRRGV